MEHIHLSLIGTIMNTQQRGQSERLSNCRKWLGRWLVAQRLWAPHPRWGGGGVASRPGSRPTCGWSRSMLLLLGEYLTSQTLSLVATSPFSPISQTLWGYLKGRRKENRGKESWTYFGWSDGHFYGNRNRGRNQPWSEAWFLSASLPFHSSEFHSLILGLDDLSGDQLQRKKLHITWEFRSFPPNKKLTEVRPTGIWEDSNLLHFLLSLTTCCIPGLL